MRTRPGSATERSNDDYDFLTVPLDRARVALGESQQKGAASNGR
jgi:hypothetical protein